MDTRDSVFMPTILAAVAAGGGILFGFDTGVISGALPEIVALWKLTPATSGLVASALLVGAVFGAAVSGKLCDLLGRRDVMMANAGMFALGAFISGQSPSVGWLILGRIVAGLAIGAVSLAAPLYIAEISPARSRGRLVSFNQLAITLGVLLSFALDAALGGQAEGWRDMFRVGAPVALLFGVAVFFLPSSPSWMVLQNDDDEARDIFARLGRGDPDAAIGENKREMTQEMGDSWVEITRPSVRPAIFMGLALFFFQQFAGINVILYYAPTALRQVGFAEEFGIRPAMMSLAVVNVAVTVVTLWLVDKVGRKALLNVGIMGMTLSLVAMGIGDIEWIPGDYRALTVIALPAYIAFFAIGLGTMCWLLIAEIYPLRIRGMAMSIPTVAHWVFNGVLTLMFPKLLDIVGFGSMTWFFAAVGLAAWFYCRRNVPETKGLGFDHIRQYWVERAHRLGKSHIMLHLVAGVAATGGLLFGLNFGIVAGVLLMVKQQWNLAPASQGLIVSSVTAGAILGSAISGKAADLFGRRYLLMGIAVVFVVGAFGCGLAPDLKWLIAGRVFSGIGVGVVALAVPMYLSEISPPAIRGKLVSINHLALVSGILLSYLINAVFAGDAEGWRSMFMVCAVPGVALGLGMLFLPESPRWMVMAGKPGGALRMLKRLGADDPEAELSSLRAALKEQRVGTWSELLKPQMRPPLIIGMALMFFSRCTGVVAVVYYAPTIFHSIGFDTPMAAMFPTVGVGVVNLAMTLVSIRLVDRLGRRSLFATGLVGVTATLGVLGAAIMAVGPDHAAAKWMMMGCLFVYMACYALSLGAVCGLIVSEIFPQRVRGLAMSVVIAGNYVIDMAVAQTFPGIVEAIGLSNTFWMYALVGVAGLFFWRFYLPETKDRSLEEIERHWNEGLPPRLMR